MRRRLRILIVLASTFAMVLMLNVGTAFAHPNEPAAPNNPFGADNAVFGPGLFQSNATVFVDAVGFDVNRGIAQGYFVHSPTCILHSH